jgi:RNA polymerase sigma-70 factor (ECF subfamily)
MTTPDERSWLDRARAGDKAAFGMLVRQHQRRVHRLAVQLTGNSGDADDVVQETFLRAYRAIDRFDGRAEMFTWLYRICVNVALNLRRQRRRVVADLDDPRVPEPRESGADPATRAEEAQSYARLAAALDGLSESLRVTMVLACVEQLPYKDIAGVLGCSEGTVAWRVHEARRRLRESLPDDVIDALDDAGPAGGVRGRRA